MRFPGGAVGNFYHFGKSGYGFDFAEIDQYHDGKVPKRARGLENSRIKKNQHQDYIDDFIQLAQETNSKAVLVANLFVDNNDILLMIEKLVTNNIEVVGVELGSELSNRSYFTKGYTIEDYIVSAKRCSKKIKDKYPNLKTAVVVAPLGKRKGHRHNVWNEKLSKLDFYDAIIIHSYAKVINGKDKEGQMVFEEAEGKNKTEAFEIYKNRAIDYLTNEYPKQVQEYVRIFNKPIWVTEWNLQMSKTTGNTLLQSLFVANYLLELLSSPDLKNNFTFSFSSNKKLGILGGVAAAIAIIVIVGFTAINTPIDSTVSSTASNPLLVNIDQTTYQRADIISISGDTNSYTKSVELSIENTNGVKIWKEIINPKNDGQFSTLIIAGGGGWENNGVYTLKAVQDDLASEIEFKIIA